MTRPCGCGGNASLTCNCAIIAGPNTEVSGTGNAEDPYVITAGGTQFTVTDTITVDLALTGDSSSLPYNLAAVVRVSATAGNLLEAVDGGLAVSCADIQGCIAAALGKGLEFDTTDRQFRARLSEQAGNTLLFGPDGGLYASADGSVAPAQPRARIGKSAQQSIPSGTTTVVAFDQPIVDNAGLFTTVGRLIAPVAGGYTIGTTIQWQSAPPNDGLRAVFLRRNGTQLIAGDQNDCAVGATTLQNVSTCVDLTAGDYVEVVVQQTDTGGPLNLLVTPNSVPTFWMYLTSEGI